MAEGAYDVEQTEEARRAALIDPPCVERDVVAWTDYALAWAGIAVPRLLEEAPSLAALHPPYDALRCPGLDLARASRPPQTPEEAAALERVLTAAHAHLYDWTPSMLQRVVTMGMTYLPNPMVLNPCAPFGPGERV
jgi:hypothetical protein